MRLAANSLAIGLLGAIGGFLPFASDVGANPPASQPGEVSIQFVGGHDTLSKDGGRPVVLISAALGVPADAFREAFDHIRPAKNGPPTEEQARQNKKELLSRLEKYGVTNERLDEVSNFYRYRPQDGELWKHRDAVAFATVKDGKVVSVRVVDKGYGYTTPPQIEIDGVSHPRALVMLEFGMAKRELTENGRIATIRVARPKGEK